MESDVQRAQRALGAACGVSQADIRVAPFGSVDAVVILDVLHYMDGMAQRDVLGKVRAALPPGGLLLLRVGDAAGGWRFRYSQWVDKVIMLLRGHAWGKHLTAAAFLNGRSCCATAVSRLERCR